MSIDEMWKIEEENLKNTILKNEAEFIKLGLPPPPRSKAIVCLFEKDKDSTTIR